MRGEDVVECQPASYGAARHSGRGSPCGHVLHDRRSALVRQALRQERRCILWRIVAATLGQQCSQRIVLESTPSSALRSWTCPTVKRCASHCPPRSERSAAAFERAATLFNLGAVSSQLAIGADLTSDAGVKTAARSFQASSVTLPQRPMPMAFSAALGLVCLWKPTT